MLIKTVVCPICRQIIDYYDDDQELVKCAKCGTVYHAACWKAMEMRKKCVVCGYSTVTNVDTDFYCHELWEDVQ